MLARGRLAALFFGLSTLTCAAVTGCAVDVEEEETDVAGGDGDGVAEDALVAERQLTGAELSNKKIALTYDDGPGPRTAELADYLAELGIPAAFFINGSKVPGKQRAIDTIVGRGHLLANHTQNHLQLTALSSDEVVQEIADTDAVLASAQPNGPFVVRAPFGAWTGSTARAVNATEMRKYVGSVFWDIGGVLSATAAADWDCWGKRYSIEACGDLYLNEIRTKGRGIVLLHDIHGNTVSMTKYIVPKLIEEGFAFVKLEDVPSVKRAIQGAALGEADEDGCSSATLGRTVAENACVQSRGDRRWYRCADGEWTESGGFSDPHCTQYVGL